ncbi:uncharacterized protein LOC110007332 [Amborella trichopoda]|uniref:uncharacterized protein LOC110007332 n=1 Tax=Amborella trichopoda TaxID=13333 RepID=UPI0009C16AF4|nr:uncharacterized protein LOC110007332 [Amborella trichopoda]|eukprot:XP_020523325.1 uncharacterized protein LOC110007332 [Amborella trichopoda]
MKKLEAMKEQIVEAMVMDRLFVLEVMYTAILTTFQVDVLQYPSKKLGYSSDHSVFGMREYATDLPKVMMDITRSPCSSWRLSGLLSGIQVSGLRQRPQVLDPDVGVPDAYPVANLRSNCIPSASALQRAGIISFEGNCTGSLRIEFFAESGDHLLRRKLHRLPQDRVFCRERGSSPTKGAAQAPSGSSFFGSCTGSLSCNGTLIIPCMRLNKFAVDLLLNMLECGSSMPWLCLTTASYVMVMRDLVREPNDVPVLCSAGILENDLSSNADASVLFTQVFYSGIASRWWPPFPLVSYESIRLQVNSRKQPVMARLFMTFSILVIGLSIIQTLYTVL